MKKVFLICTALMGLLLASCNEKIEVKPVNIDPISMESDGIFYEIDPRSEVMIIACRLAGVRAFSEGSNSEYVMMVEKLFDSQKEHPLVKQIKKASKKFQGDAYYEMEIVKYISSDMTELFVTKETMPDFLKEFWGNVNLKDFIANFNDFAHKGNFERIWKMSGTSLKGEITGIKDFYTQKPEILSFMKEYFYSKDDSLKIVISTTPLLGGWIVPLPVYEEGNQKILRVYQSNYGNPKSNYDDFYVYQELVTALMNKLLNENWDTCYEKVKPILEKVFTENKIPVKRITTAGFKSNAAIVLSRVASTKYLYTYKEEVLADEINKSNRKYLLIKDLSQYDAMMEYYESNRNNYPSFEKFFTEYLLENF